MTGLLVVAGVGLGVLWVARLLHTGCARWLPLAALVTAWLLLAHPPGRELGGWVAERLIVGVQLLAWAMAPLVVAWLLVRVMVRLGRRRVRPGSAGGWVSLWLVLSLGLVAGLLLHQWISVMEPLVGSGFVAVVEAGLWLAALLLGLDRPGPPFPT